MLYYAILYTIYILYTITDIYIYMTILYYYSISYYDINTYIHTAQLGAATKVLQAAAGQVLLLSDE